VSEGRLARAHALLSRRPHRRRWIALALAAVVLAVAWSVVYVMTQDAPLRVSQQFVSATPEPTGGTVRLDTSLYLPASTPAPAVLLAHGFGGTKTDLDSQARSLAHHGYVVLTYTARGFGTSGGMIHLDSQQFEVADGSRLIDYLQTRPEVLERAGRPVVGVAGSSYGGALALMLGAMDHRVSAVAADITWNDLQRALFPNDASNGPAGSTDPGVLKKLWAGFLFSAGLGPASSNTASSNTASPNGGGSADGDGPCGRFAPGICALYQSAAQGKDLNPAMVKLLEQSSPSTVLTRMSAPTLLTQGEQDSLFPLSEADANAKQITAAGAPVQVRWRSGGHDAASAADDVAGWQTQFFDQRLRGAGADPSNGFRLDQRGAGISATDGQRVNTTLQATNGYPGVGTHPAAPMITFGLQGKKQTINAPAGGNPAAISSIPTLGDLIGTASNAGLAGAAGLSKVPGQTASFTTPPLSQPQLITGASRVRLQVRAAGDLTAFVALHDLGPDGSDSLPAQLVSPIRLAPDGRTVTTTVELPWIVAHIPAGHRLAVVVSTTDFAYSMPSDPRSYAIALDPADAQLAVPMLQVSTLSNGGPRNWLIVAAIVLLACVGYGAWRLRARRPSAPDATLAAVPIVVTDLVKEYSDGYRAVDGVSFRVERGQVLGLLGPNGAGKTTTLRVLMGLILPTSGTVRVFGEEVVPGAPALSLLGAFVEGPGLLPHLTGRDNLRLYWAASGRPSERAHFETVLEIAGLGASLDRRVKTYSHGMQQRLAIAQAMLGLPEVLVLDEPTNGLDPPQIAEMREVLHRYSATGRTVIVSSHLLAEVEQTCSHVVVMHRGQLVAAGSVSEVAGMGATQLVVADPEHATDVLAAAGISARSVPGRRALEDVFLDLIGERND
jgi:ABC-2 type transport system ATP-binding protein